LDWLGLGFASELRMEMTRNKDIQVIKDIPDGDNGRAADTIARFVISGEILNDIKGIKIIVTLTDTLSNLQIWSKGLTCGSDPLQLIAFQKIIVQTVAAQIGCEKGVIANTIFTESTDKAPEQLKTYEAILRFLEYEQAPTEEGFIQALYGLEHAKKLEPLCSRVWPMLARLYIIIYSLEIPGFALGDAKKKAVSHAEKGARLAPDSQFTHTILAFVRLITDESTAAKKEALLAYELHPDSVVLLDLIGYVMALSGDWEQGTELIRKAIRSNPYYHDHVHHALWANWIRQKDYEQAYQETMHFRNPQIFWEPLIKASTLGNLGRLKEGKNCLEDLLALKPDFPSRGRILISRFIKYQDMTESTVNGLKKCGLELA
jgi:adenylate cyclase